MVIGPHLELFGNRCDQADKLGEFVLGKQVDVEIEVVTLVGRLHRPILADQHEGRQEDCLDGSDHSQNNKGGIEVWKVRQQVGNDPASVDNQVDIHEAHAAGETGNRVCNLVL